VKIPAQIRAGDTVKWRDDPGVDNLGNEISSGTWTLSYYLRTNTASEGATVVGTAYGQGWEFTLSAATSAGFDAGQWYWQAIATSGSEKVTLGAGQFEVLAAVGGRFSACPDGGSLERLRCGTGRGGGCRC